MDEYLTTKQIARILKVHVITIRRWIQSGKLIAYKIGKELRIKKSDLDSFINKSKVKI